VTAREEIQRLAQRGNLLHADVLPVEKTSVADIDEKAFNAYFVEPDLFIFASEAISHSQQHRPASIQKML
jgi:hypothetical protein